MANTNPDRSGSLLLRIREVTKSFPGTIALDAMDLDVRAGEVHALLGENGAGKSTLIKILAGIYPADHGSIQLRGQEWVPARWRHEIAFIHQDLGLVESMTVAENIAHALGFPARGPLISWKAVREQAVDVLQRVGAEIDPDLLISQLSQAQRSVVAIARAVAAPEASILVLDEPTASLQQREVDRLFETLAGLRQAGLGMIYVSHRLDEVTAISDRVTVMRDGRAVLTTETVATDRDRLVAAITGHALAARPARPAVPRAGVVALSVNDLATRTATQVSFDLHEGEVLALVGLEGAGQQSVGRAIYGVQQIDGGKVHVHGRRLDRRSPLRLIENGVGIVPGKRAEEAIAPDRSVRENLFPNTVLQDKGRSSWIRPRSERAQAAGLVDQFRIRTLGTENAVGTLSGGNQQKVVLARWLASRSRILILEDPTVGVDVGAKAEIYQMVDELVGGGGSVLLISTDFEEVERIAHRALVFNRGQIVASLEGDQVTIADLVGAASDSNWEGNLQ